MAQTIEGGGDVRVTTSGLAKIALAAAPRLTTNVSSGYCVSPGQVGTPSGGFLATGARYCATNQVGTPQIPDACGATNGCNASLERTSAIQLTPMGDGSVRADFTVRSGASVPISGQVIGIGFSCTLGMTAAALPIRATLTFGVDTDSGATTMAVTQLSGIEAMGFDFAGCSIVSDVAGLLNALYNAFVGAVTTRLAEGVRDVAQSFVPALPVLEGRFSSAAILAHSPSSSEMEARLFTGGYAGSANDGITLGLVTGFNADADPATRGAMSSEPASCAADVQAPALTAPPFGLTPSSRGTFALVPDGPLVGDPELASDAVFGVPTATLRLLGHHLAASGALCFEASGSDLPVLTTGILSGLVPSLLHVGTGEEKLRVVAHPKKGVAFRVNATGAPLTATLQDYAVDLFADFGAGEVPIASFTADTSMDLNFAFRQLAGERATVLPLLAGMSHANVRIAPTRYPGVTELDAALATALPALLDFVLPRLANNWKPMALPSVGGFDLDSPSVEVSASGAAWLLVRGTLATLVAPTEPAAVRYDVTLEKVVTPRADVIRAALAGQSSGELPRVTLSAPTTDAGSQPLEWTWRLDGGFWHSFASSAPLTVTDPSFAWQGKHSLEVAARTRNTNGVWSAPISVPVVIDSIGPRILKESFGEMQGVRWEGNVLHVPAVDAVYGRTGLEWAFGSAGASVPSTSWAAEGTAQRDTIAALAGDSGAFSAFVRDPSGNVSVVTLDYPRPASPDNGTMLTPEGGETPAGATPPAASEGCGCRSARGHAAPASALALGIWSSLLRKKRTRTSRGRPCKR